MRAAIVVALTLGFTTGAGMVALTAVGRPVGAAWVTHLQPHGVAQLFGWAGLSVMGIAMHVVPRFRGDAAVRFPWPQRAVLWLVLAAIVLRAVGQTVYGSPASAPLLVASGAALLAGVAVFVLTLAEVLRGGRHTQTPLERWLWTGLAWALAAAVLHLAVVWQMAAGERLSAPAGLNRAFVLAAAFGFVGHFLLGVSLRASAGFLGLRLRRRRVELVAYAAIEAGLLLLVGSAIVGPSQPARGAAGGLLLAAGLALFVAALRVLERPAISRPVGPGGYARFAWFLVAAYVWLLVAAVALAGETGSLLRWWAWPVQMPNVTLHTVALGFISMTIIGFAARVLPLFEGRALRRSWPLDVALVALNAATALRLASSFQGIPFGSRGIALSGALALLAVAAFAAVAWPLLGSGRRARWVASETRLDVVGAPARPGSTREGWQSGTEMRLSGVVGRQSAHE